MNLAQKIDALLECQWFYTYADGYFSLEAAALATKINAKLLTAKTPTPPTP